MQGNRSGTCRCIAAVVLALLLAVTLGGSALGASPRVKLGNEVLLEKSRPLVAGKRVGLVTNQTGGNGRGESLIDILYHAGDINLVALYGPELGIYGRAKAGE